MCVLCVSFVYVCFFVCVSILLTRLSKNSGLCALEHACCISGLCWNVDGRPHWGRWEAPVGQVGGSKWVFLSRLVGRQGGAS